MGSLSPCVLQCSDSQLRLFYKDVVLFWSEAELSNEWIPGRSLAWLQTMKSRRCAQYIPERKEKRSEMIKWFLQNVLHVANKCQSTMKHHETWKRKWTRYQIFGKTTKKTLIDLEATKASCLQSIWNRDLLTCSGYRGTLPFMCHFRDKCLQPLASSQQTLR